MKLIFKTGGEEIDLADALGLVVEMDADKTDASTTPSRWNKVSLRCRGREGGTRDVPLECCGQPSAAVVRAGEIASALKEFRSDDGKSRANVPPGGTVK
jgi:hypothetical protein